MRYLNKFAASALLACLVGASAAAAQNARSTPPSASVRATDKPTHSDENLRILLKRFSALPGLSAKYQEEKHIAILAKPLNSQGDIFFQPPDQLTRYTYRPEKSQVSITGTRLTMSDASGSREVELRGQPVLRLVVESFLRLLSGDLNTLNRVYHLRFSGSAHGAWHIDLEPRDAPLTSFIQRVFVEGNQLVVARMEIAETNGDRTVTRFSDVNVSKRFTDAERARLFRTNSKR